MDNIYRFYEIFQVFHKYLIYEKICLIIGVLNLVFLIFYRYYYYPEYKIYNFKELFNAFKKKSILIRTLLLIDFTFIIYFSLLITIFRPPLIDYNIELTLDTISQDSTISVKFNIRNISDLPANLLNVRLQVETMEKNISATNRTGFRKLNDDDGNVRFEFNFQTIDKDDTKSTVFFKINKLNNGDSIHLKCLCLSDNINEFAKIVTLKCLNNEIKYTFYNTKHSITPNVNDGVNVQVQDSLKVKPVKPSSDEVGSSPNIQQQKNDPVEKKKNIKAEKEENIIEENSQVKKEEKPKIEQEFFPQSKIDSVKTK